uniref:Ig-like domain-containing protein n=1 Tax=Glossina brevipalpis TaxID=37001 RepID=A0A1A9WLL0_9MUSC
MIIDLAEHNYIANGLDLQGPIFLHEPPHRVEFSNNSGGLIECSVTQPMHKHIKKIDRFFANNSENMICNFGLKSVEWTPIPPQQDMVFTLSNGSLMFYPFSAEKYRHEVHATVYRCKLRNLVGTVLSREIHVRGDELAQMKGQIATQMDVVDKALAQYLLSLKIARSCKANDIIAYQGLKSL